MHNKICKILLLIFFFSSAIYSQQRFELDAIEIHGNKSFNAEELKLFLASKETPVWYWKFLNSFTSFGKPPEYFDSTRIKSDIKSLKSFYNANGFFDVQVFYKYRFNNENKEAVITYNISEGKSYSYQHINLNYQCKIPEEFEIEIRSKLNADSTERYSEDEIKSIITSSINYLQDHGYMLAGYDSTIVGIDTTHHKVSVDIYIEPGIRYKVNRIIVEKTGPGEKSVSEPLLKNLVSIKNDEYYSREKIGKIRYRLFTTGLFNSIQIDGSMKDTVGNTVPVRLRTEIGLLNEISPEIIADSELGAFNFGLGVNYIRKNFLGDARKLTLSAKFKIIDVLNFEYAGLFKKSSARDSAFQGEMDLSLQLDNPYFLTLPVNAQLKTYLQTATIYNINVNTYGIKASFNFEMPSYTVINLLKPYYNLEFNEISTREISFFEDDVLYKLALRSNSRTSLAGVELGSSHTNDFFFPTRGININFKLAVGRSASRFYGSIRTESESIDRIDETGIADFYRLEYTNALFVPLAYDNTEVLAGKFKIGYIQAFKGGYEWLPYDVTFFAGGSNSVRGWRQRELNPEKITEYSDTLRGGTMLIEGTFEYRKKIVPEVGGVFFIDYGNVWNGYRQISINDFAVAAGTGLRYYSPIAPLRLDFGFKFYNPYDKKFIFKKQFWKQLEIHFGIGEVF